MTEIGEASTVAELIAILSTLPSDKPVRTHSLSHTWPVTVKDQGDLVLLTFG